MITAYNYTGIIATYTVSYGCTMDHHVYVHFFSKILRPVVRQNCSQTISCVIILYTHPHIATSFTTVFQEYSWEVLNHLPYSPNLSPPDYNLFPKLKEQLKEPL